MNKLKTLFENLAKKAGVDITDAEFAKTLELIKDFEVSDDIATKLESNLYDIEGAKQNYTLKQHFTATSLNGVDAQLKEALSELIEDDSTISEILGIKTTNARIKASLFKIRELESAKAKAEGKGDDGKAKKAQEEIDKLIADFKTKEATYLSQIEQEKSSKFSEIEKLQHKFFLQGLDYDKSKTMEENLLLADFHINNELQAKGVKRIYNTETDRFELKRADDITLDYLDERNNKTSYEDFSKGVLLNRKLLAVSDAGATPPNPNTQESNVSHQVIDTSAYENFKIPE
jgi:hypothetical protein